MPLSMSEIWKDRVAIITIAGLLAGAWMYHEHAVGAVQGYMQQQLKQQITDQQSQLKQTELQNQALSVESQKLISQAQNEITALTRSLAGLQSQVVKLADQRQTAVAQVASASLQDVAQQTSSAIGQPVTVTGDGEFLATPAAKAALAKIIQEQFDQQTVAAQSQELAGKDQVTKDQQTVIDQKSAQLTACQQLTEQQKALLSSQSDDLGVYRKQLSSEERKGWLRAILGFFVGMGAKGVL